LSSERGHPGRMNIPIACSLSSADLAGRVDEWKDFFTTTIQVVERAHSSVRLRLGRSEPAFAAAVSLAEREKECCAFFEFSLELGTDGWWLRIAVPSEARAMLDELVSLVPTRL
jgi:hypothetical protein